MKNKIIALCLMVILLLPLLSCGFADGGEVTLMIANDLHFIESKAMIFTPPFRNRAIQKS